jgi:omega-amidase
MKADLIKVALVQLDICWKNPQRNLNQIDRLIETISADLIVLPEMFATGFIHDPDQTELGDAISLDWMKQTAQRKNAAVTGSLAVEEKGVFYNRMYFVTPDHKVVCYDKKHLFALGNEAKVFQPGQEPVLASYKGWTFSLSICYDLRFPAWARYHAPYDVFLCVANWPTPRVNAWDSLLCARAIENQCYAIGVNRVGEDDKVKEYPGHSTTFTPIGESLSSQFGECVLRHTLSKNELQAVRKKLPYLKDRDIFDFKI